MFSEKKEAKAMEKVTATDKARDNLQCWQTKCSFLLQRKFDHIKEIFQCPINNTISWQIADWVSKDIQSNKTG